MKHDILALGEVGFLADSDIGMHLPIGSSLDPALLCHAASISRLHRAGLVIKVQVPRYYGIGSQKPFWVQYLGPNTSYVGTIVI